MKFCKAKRKLEECRVEVEGCGNGLVQWCSCLIFGNCCWCGPLCCFVLIMLVVVSLMIDPHRF